MHLDHDDLVLSYYDELEPAGRRRLGEHLASCEACAAEYARLQSVLALVETAPSPEPGEGFERQMWARLQPRLEARARWWRRGVLGMPLPWAATGALAGVIVAAFLGGWLARDRTGDPAGAQTDADATVAERLLRVALGDHLEQSHMVLLELMHAEDAAVVALATSRERAAELVANNRLYRQTAAFAGDQTLADVLSELERVLVEIANAPPDGAPDLNNAELTALRERLERRGILFRVRVLSSELRARARSAAETQRSPS